MYIKMLNLSYLLMTQISKYIKATNKLPEYKNANEILKSISYYMLLDRLHINTSRCCFIDFKPKIYRGIELDNEEHATKM